MKKLIAMVMTAAMVASLVPATAFAGDATASAKIVDALELTKEQAKNNATIEAGGDYDVPELQLTIKDATYRKGDAAPTTEVTLELDNADWITANSVALTDLYRIVFADRDDQSENQGYTDATLGTDETHFQMGTDKIVPGEKVTIETPAQDLSVSGHEDKAVTWLKQYATFALITTPTTDIEYTANTTGATAKVVYDYTNKVWQNGFANVDELMDAVANGDGTITSGSNQIQVTFKHSLDNTSTITLTSGGSAVSPAPTFSLQDGTLNTITTIKKEDQIIAYAIAGGYSAVTVLKTDANQVTGGAADGDEVILKEVKDIHSDEATFVFEGKFVEGDKIIFYLESVLDRTGINKYAAVSVSGDLGDFDDMVYATVLSRGITATTKKVGTIAEEEVANLEKDLKIKSTVGDFVKGQEFTLRLSSGFEFTKKTTESAGVDYVFGTPKDNEVTLTWNGADTDEITINAGDIEIEATSAKEGATCTMTVKSVKSAITGTFAETAKVEVLKVVEYDVIMSVDEDEDVPVIYSGVNVDNYGLTDDSDHLSLEVTIEESFPGAWSFNKGFDIELPEGVYVTAVNVTDADNFNQDSQRGFDSEAGWEQALWDAYQNGDHTKFEFKKRVFDNTDVTLNPDEATVTFELELVADPTFAGDVVLKLTGDAFDEAQEVTIAKFVKPYTVKAEQNDLKIDYRYTEVPTEIVVTEAEAGLWDADKAEFAVYVEKPNYIVFEDDPTFTVDKNSGMELTKDELVSGNWDGSTAAADKFDAIHFTVDKESDEAATVTISDLSLFMDRTIPAGAYALKGWTSMAQKYEAQTIFAPDCEDEYGDTCSCSTSYTVSNDDDNDCFVGDVCDYSKVVKEAFVNVVTAGREQDDASFTTKVVVPVGENKIVAGETEYTIDAPAYINANGYTMLPVRAVAVALGINNNNVLWDQATKTVTILYGQRIITMQVGASVVYVNGAALPASSSVEITNNRTFLGLRDLATALGVTDITWDASTKTATLNGGNTAE